MLENKKSKEKKKPPKSNSIFLPALLIVKSIVQFPFVLNISSSFCRVLFVLSVIKERKSSFFACPSYLLQDLLTNTKNYSTEECTKHSLNTYSKEPSRLVDGDFNALTWKTTMCEYGHGHSHFLKSECTQFSM